MAYASNAEGNFLVLFRFSLPGGVFSFQWAQYERNLKLLQELSIDGSRSSFASVSQVSGQWWSFSAIDFWNAFLSSWVYFYDPAVFLICHHYSCSPKAPIHLASSEYQTWVLQHCILNYFKKYMCFFGHGLGIQDWDAFFHYTFEVVVPIYPPWYWDWDIFIAYRRQTALLVSLQDCLCSMVCGACFAVGHCTGRSSSIITWPRCHSRQCHSRNGEAENSAPRCSKSSRQQWRTVTVRPEGHGCGCPIHTIRSELHIKSAMCSVCYSSYCT